ncbi:uncharacterized protein LOC110924091 [Helianthus annuus]|uniref:uncharacterized protein LOC110924091 n=1 Tax=Helianthus annuus TaxID=4232 RepID=UPI000B8F745B|nr:uncharacterized protein LOC110924091 [Helianthus annuus]
MLGSIDRMYWRWENCSIAWHGQYTLRGHEYATIMLKAAASCETCFFGVVGLNNDINVIDQSLIFNDVLKGFQPPCNFTVNDQMKYNHGYYLVDEIYQKLITFVKRFSHRQGKKIKLLKKKHESAKNDVEMAFCVLQTQLNGTLYKDQQRFGAQEL